MRRLYMCTVHCTVLLFFFIANILLSSAQKTTLSLPNPSWFFISISGKYKHNVNCVVNYLMDETCAEMKFSCKKINIKNKNKKLCNKGDTLVISTENEEKL